MKTIDETLQERLREACVGNPAKVAWPHRILHEAADEITKLRAERDEAKAENVRLRGYIERVRDAMDLFGENEAATKLSSGDKNALMWKWVNEVAEHVVQHTGQDAEDVHEFFKQKFLRPKIIELNGEAIVYRTTKKLTTSQMSEYMERIYAWATSELGLLLPLPSELGRDE